MIECDWPRAEKNQAEGQSRDRQRELISVLPHQSVVEVHLGDGDGKIDADNKSGDSGEQTDQDQDAAKEFGKSGEISGPAGKAEAGDELNVVMKSAENLLISMAGHDGAEGQTHHQECEGLKTIEVAQVSSSREEPIDYRRRVVEGSEPAYRGIHHRVSGLKHFRTAHLYEPVFKVQTGTEVERMR